MSKVTTAILTVVTDKGEVNLFQITPYPGSRSTDVDDLVYGIKNETDFGIFNVVPGKRI